MTISFEYQETNAPIKSVTVGNPQGFKDLVVTVDTVGGSRNPRTRRFNISNGEQSVKLAVSEVDDFIEALERMVDYGLDQSAVA